jgi:cytochrome c oxidase subunit 2
MLGIAAVVFLTVLVLLLVGLLKGRDGRTAATTEPGDPGVDRRWMRVVVLGGIVAPALVLGGLMGLNVYSERVVAANARPEQLEIEVIGHRWWWEVHYPQQGFTTANEIHIPAGRPVKFKLASGDVIHSFWVPQLGGKRDLVPGQTNVLTLQADKPGTYRGQCAEYCGLEHAMMAFLVVADTPEQFTAWAAAQAKDAAAPSDPQAREGLQVFLGAACVYCHTLRGTPASSRVGPDLTHLASRRTIAAAMLPNQEANLRGWIVNAQALKPGNKMPPMYLGADELNALVKYLQTLK